MTHAADHRQPATTNLDIAERLFSAIERGDLDTVRELYAPGCEIWHNNDQQVQTVEQNMRTLIWVTTNVKGFRYEDVKRQATETGFIEQHMTCGTGPSGVEFRFPACIVVTIVDGKISRLDEYFDSAHLAPLVG
ncbi:MAG: nuclear transport factor 2 family protein [Dehalococcoidia bacterium]